MIAPFNELYPDHAEWQQLCQDLQQALNFSALIWVALQMGLWLARQVAQQELHRRSQQPLAWPQCPECGHQFHSKGWRSRQMQTLIGTLIWKRRVGRCSQGCPGSQCVPLDVALGIAPHQQTDEGLLRLGILLCLTMPYGLAQWVLGQWNGVSLSATTLWQQVQRYGQAAQQDLQQQLLAYQNGGSITAETLDAEVAQKLLAIGADGVTVPFRPQAKTPKGKTQWREVKVALLARIGQRVTRSGQQVTQLLHRRVVAVLGDIDTFMPQLQLEAHRQSFAQAPQLVWLSDGAKGFWRVFEQCFSHCAVGILDFYHAAGQLARVAEIVGAGDSDASQRWFGHWRHQLRHRHPRQVLADLTRVVNIEQVFTPEEMETLVQVQGYFQRLHPHMRYAEFKEQGFPLGSGMIESTCKWLIQQRFKGVGMRWSEAGFNHLLILRVAWVNQRFDALFPQVTWTAHLPSPIA